MVRQDHRITNNIFLTCERRPNLYTHKKLQQYNIEYMQWFLPLLMLILLFLSRSSYLILMVYGICSLHKLQFEKLVPKRTKEEKKKQIVFAMLIYFARGLPVGMFLSMPFHIKLVSCFYFHSFLLSNMEHMHIFSLFLVELFTAACQYLSKA